MWYSDYQFLSHNVAIGESAGSSIGTNYNIAIGAQSLPHVTSGIGENVAIGYQAGYYHGE